MANDNGPLTDDDFEDMKRRLAELDEADKLIEKSIRAGIDMTQQKQRSAELREQLMRLRQSFFPGRQ